MSLVVFNAVRAERRRRLVRELIDEAVEAALETNKDSPEMAEVELDLISEQVARAPRIPSADRLRHQSVIAEARRVVEARRIELDRRRELIDTSCGQPIRDAGKMTH